MMIVKERKKVRIIDYKEIERALNSICLLQNIQITI